jgi:hypothetical protein
MLGSGSVCRALGIIMANTALILLVLMVLTIALAPILLSYLGLQERLVLVRRDGGLLVAGLVLLRHQMSSLQVGNLRLLRLPGPQMNAH